ncbi:uncharacterized protein LOC129741513 [Uranotaenia lowii]|uniref:uncharacterized protein LOC129741513 n=1 Tax=Uranotaenia lowii TaxID=190385 RepID=UPI00247B0948|nr:uncharacterized protein LOC129741513 [Uranotaenia lowii]
MTSRSAHHQEVPTRKKTCDVHNKRRTRVFFWFSTTTNELPNVVAIDADLRGDYTKINTKRNEICNPLTTAWCMAKLPSSSVNDKKALQGNLARLFNIFRATANVGYRIPPRKPDYAHQKQKAGRCRTSKTLTENDPTSTSEFPELPTTLRWAPEVGSSALPASFRKKSERRGSKKCASCRKTPSPIPEIRERKKTAGTDRLAPPFGRYHKLFRVGRLPKRQRGFGPQTSQNCLFVKSPAVPPLLCRHLEKHEVESKDKLLSKPGEICGSNRPTRKSHADPEIACRKEKENCTQGVGDDPFFIYPSGTFPFVHPGALFLHILTTVTDNRLGRVSTRATSFVFPWEEQIASVPRGIFAEPRPEQTGWSPRRKIVDSAYWYRTVVSTAAAGAFRGSAQDQRPGTHRLDSR